MIKESKLDRVLRLLDAWGIPLNPLDHYEEAFVGNDLLNAMRIALANVIPRQGDWLTRQALRRKDERAPGAWRNADRLPNDKLLGGVLQLLSDTGLALPEETDRDNFLENLDLTLTALLGRRGREDWPVHFPDAHERDPDRAPPLIGEERLEDLGI